MTVGFNVLGSEGNRLSVGPEGEMGVVIHQHPPAGESIVALPFSQWFTDNGETSGAGSLLVNGATTNQEFYITAKPDKDIYIKTISVLIGDSGATLNQFGSLAALTNGVSWEITTSELGTVVLQDEIKTNLDFIRLGLGSPSFGTGTNAFKADISGGGADSYLPVIDLDQVFGLDFGLILRKKTRDKISFVIKDNLTGLDTFNIKGFGIQM